MSGDIEEKVRLEIEELHEFFVGWFNGSLPESAFETDFMLGLDDLVPAIRDGYASNPNFRIEIREVQVHWTSDDYVMATYEEWQRNALASTPPDNARVATVLFKGPEPLKWLHIHETWLPPESMSAGPYDF
jgi:hypothetical protein